MKRVMLLSVLSLLMVTYMTGQKVEKVEKVKKEKTETVVYLVSMDCEGCLNKIKKELTFAKGVKELYLNLETQIVAIKFNPSKTDKEKLAEVIKKMGHTATEQQSKEKLPVNW